MSRPFRLLIRLMVGLSAVVLTGMGGAAFASVPPPDPAVTPDVQTLSVPVTSAAGSGMAWWVVLLIAAGAIAVGVLFTQIVHTIRRHRPASGAVTA